MFILEWEDTYFIGTETSQPYGYSMGITCSFRVSVLRQRRRSLQDEGFSKMALASAAMHHSSYHTTVN